MDKNEEAYWVCDGCKKEFNSEEKAQEHEKTCNQMYWKREEKERKRIAESFEKDKLANPRLALISDHLWWLALMVKISLIMMLISIILMLTLGY